MLNYNKHKGFTLIELLIVLAVLGFLITGAVYAVNEARKKSRDTIRLNNMAEIQKALALYLNENGTYPESDGEGTGGWDTGGDGDFIHELVTKGYIDQDVMDPLTNNDDGNYRYFLYAAGARGCNPDGGRFYVLQIRDLETSSGAHSESPGFACDTDWGLSGEWTAGMYER
jgi:prepilin-type N-terminal cleavage/methylation domain-containing protein